MNKYNVTIQAVITKTVSVVAQSEDEAIHIAHESFSVLNDDTDERYEQDCLEVELDEVIGEEA
jgi:hypothetical protein